MRQFIAGLTAIAMLITTPCFALEHLEGQAALDYIGNDLKSRLINEGYTYEVLKRSHRDTMNGRFSDGVIFSKVSKKFYYKKRNDGEHVFIINDPRGRAEDPVSADPLVWNPLSNTLSDDHPYAHVFLHENQEIAILYVGTKTRLKSKINKEGLLEIDLRIRGQRKRKYRKT